LQNLPTFKLTSQYIVTESQINSLGIKFLTAASSPRLHFISHWPKELRVASHLLLHQNMFTKCTVGSSKEKSFFGSSKKDKDLYKTNLLRHQAPNELVVSFKKILRSQG